MLLFDNINSSTHKKANKIRTKLLIFSQKDVNEHRKYHNNQVYPNQKFIGDLLINSKTSNEIFQPPTYIIENLNEEYNETTRLRSNEKIEKINKLVDLLSPKKNTRGKSILSTRSNKSVQSSVSNLSNDDNIEGRDRSRINNSDLYSEYDSIVVDLYEDKKRKNYKMKYTTPFIDKCMLITEKDLFSKPEAISGYDTLQFLAKSLSKTKRKDTEKFINFDVIRAKAVASSSKDNNAIKKSVLFSEVKPESPARKSAIGLLKFKLNTNVIKCQTSNLEKTPSEIISSPVRNKNTSVKFIEPVFEKRKSSFSSKADIRQKPSSKVYLRRLVILIF